MKINTKFFGEVEIADDKIITFDKGIIGFPELKHFTMLHDEEKGSNVGIRYLQSLEEPGFAMPVMDPLLVNPDYDPEVDDELLTGVGTSHPGEHSGHGDRDGACRPDEDDGEPAGTLCDQRGRAQGLSDHP